MRASRKTSKCSSGPTSSGQVEANLRSRIFVDTFSSAVSNAVYDDQDPSLADLPGNSTSIWAGGQPTVLGAMYGWLYDDGYGGDNEDCTSPTASGCWGHRDAILGDSSTMGAVAYGDPTEMDAVAGTDQYGNPSYAAIFVANPNPPPTGDILFTWAGEQQYITSEPLYAPSTSSVTLGGTSADPTVTIAGSNFGADPPASTPETCNSGDTGDLYGYGGLVLQDLTENNWAAGDAATASV